MTQMTLDLVFLPTYAQDSSSYTTENISVSVIASGVLCIWHTGNELEA